MNSNKTSNPWAAGATAPDQPTTRPATRWPAESWDLAPRPTEDAASGPHARPVVVMLGLFTLSGSTVSAVMLERGDVVWLDLITGGGWHTSPLAVVHDVTGHQPQAIIEPRHQYWAQRPEIRWHLSRQTSQLYRAYLKDRLPGSARIRPEQQSHLESPSCPEPRPRPRPAPSPDGRASAADEFPPDAEG